EIFLGELALPHAPALQNSTPYTEKRGARMHAAYGSWNRRMTAPVQMVALVLLAVLTLLPTVLGRAGFMLVDRDVTERIFPLHTHGVAGEDQYIHTHGAPAPFVHPHC